MKWYMVFLIVIAMCLAVSTGAALSDQASAVFFKTREKKGDGKATAKDS